LWGGGHAEDKMRGNFTAAGGFYGCGWLNLLDGALNSYSTPQELNSDTIYIYIYIYIYIKDFFVLF
jgi:hypothetical protein